MLYTASNGLRATIQAAIRRTLGTKRFVMAATKTTFKTLTATWSQRATVTFSRAIVSRTAR